METLVPDPIPAHIYKDASIPPEDSLYEHIPAREGNQQLIQQSRQPVARPTPKPCKGNKLKERKGRSISSQPTSPQSPTSVAPAVEDIYEDASVPPEESMYEPIPAREGNQQLIQQSRQPVARPTPKPRKGNKLKE